MKYKTIPKTTLKVSVISLGTWAFGGINWGDSREKDLMDAISIAHDYGINLIDTAPVYGNGQSETIVGKAIKRRRDKFIIASKCGLIGKGKAIKHDLSKNSLLNEIDASLKRLQTDYIDIYQCHWPDKDTPLEETLETLNKFKDLGKIKHIGISNFGADLLKKSASISKISLYQGPYSLLDRFIEKDILPLLPKEEMGLLTYGALGGGILSGKYTSQPIFKPSDARSFFYKYFSKNNFPKTQKFLDSLKIFNKPLGQMAINWIRQQPATTSVIVGCRNKNQIRENAAAADWDLSEDEIKKISDMTPVFE